MWGAGPLTVKRGLLGTAGVPVRGSSRGLCSWFCLVVSLGAAAAAAAAFLCAAVAGICNCCVAGGGEKGGLGSHEGILRTPCPHEPWQRMVNAMLLLTGSITFLYFTLYGLAERRTSELREVRPEGDPRSLYYSIIFPE